MSYSMLLKQWKYALNAKNYFFINILKGILSLIDSSKWASAMKNEDYGQEWLRRNRNDYLSW